MLRFEYHQASFNSPSFGITNQSINARGVTLAMSAGYHHVFANSRWFFEPSGGLIISRTQIDQFQLGGLPPPGGGVPGTILFNDIKSTVGRVGVRVGTSFEFAWLGLAALRRCKHLA